MRPKGLVGIFGTVMTTVRLLTDMGILAERTRRKSWPDYYSQDLLML